MEVEMEEDEESVGMNQMEGEEDVENRVYTRTW